MKNFNELSRFDTIPDRDRQTDINLVRAMHCIISAVKQSLACARKVCWLYRALFYRVWHGCKPLSENKFTRRRRSRDTEELHQRILSVWNEFNQRVIDWARPIGVAYSSTASTPNGVNLDKHTADRQWQCWLLNDHDILLLQFTPLRLSSLGIVFCTVEVKCWFSLRFCPVKQLYRQASAQ